MGLLRGPVGKPLLQSKDNELSQEIPLGIIGQENCQEKIQSLLRIEDLIKHGDSS
jgi:hypothetical protein